MKTAIDALKNLKTSFQVKRLLPGQQPNYLNKGMFLEIGNQTYWVSPQKVEPLPQNNQPAYASSELPMAS